MTAILYDSTRKSKSRKSRPFATKLQPQSRPRAFEPSEADRQWCAAQYAERYDWGTTELNHIEQTARTIGDSLEGARVHIRKIEAILNDEPVLGADYEQWLDRLAWESRMQDALDGVEFEPRSTPITDEDINNVNVAG